MKGRPVRARILGALSWSLADSAGVQILRFIVGIALARILAPDDFGLIAMLAIFTFVAIQLIDGGFSSALIQKREIDARDKSTVFWFNIASSALVAGLMFGLAPLVADFYGEPQLEPITRAMATLFIIYGFVAVQSAQLTRDLEFATLAKANLTATAVSGCIALLMATQNFGVWSLVGYQVTEALVRALLLLLLCPWRPTNHFSHASLKSLFRFGSRMAASGVLDSVFSNLYLVVIGRAYGAVDVGVYSRAVWLTQTPIQTLSQVVGRVIFPVFSTFQEDAARLRRNMGLALRVMALVSFPMMIGILAITEPLVRVVLTEKWLEAVPFIKLMCVVGGLYPLHVINLNLLMAKGRSDLFLRLEVLKKALVLLNILITWRYGIAWMIVGQILLSAIAYFFNSYWTTRLIAYGPWEQAKDVIPYLMTASVMGLLVVMIGTAEFPTDWIRLVIQILAGMSFYGIACVAMRLRAVDDIMGVLQEQRSARKRA